MSNNLLNISMITNEGLMILENELGFSANINREYDDRFAVAGAKIGYTVNVRRPPRFVGTTGPALAVEDFNETSVPVTLTTQFHVDTQFTTADLSLSLDMFSNRLLKPAIATVANRIDFDGLTMGFANVANTVGTPGSTPSAALTWLQAGALLDSEAVPRDGRRSIAMDPWSMAGIVDGLKGLFNPQSALSDNYRKGLIGANTLGFDWYMDQNVVAYTVGAQGGSPAFTTTGTSTALLTSGWADQGTLQTSGWTASANPRLNVGDVFTIALVTAANPQNRSAFGSNRLRQFVVRPATGTTLLNGTFAAVTDSAGVVTGGTYSSKSDGTLTLVISPCIISAGQFKNVTVAPANSAAITVLGTAGTVSPQNLAYHRNFATLVMADLEMPEGVHFAGRGMSREANLSMRIVRQYTINNDAIPCRIDVLYGWAPLYRELCARVAG